MNAEILAVGTELLLGQIANTNAQYLSERLSELGINVYFHTVVGDNPGRIKEALAIAESRSDIIITTGGLGPTPDDLTKETVAGYFGLKMVCDEQSRKDIDDFFARLNRPVTDNNYKQAYTPEGSIVLRNCAGTAPGCIVECRGKTVVILPGPPSEMRGMFEKEVYPYLSSKTGTKIKSRIIRVFGMGESVVAEKLDGLIANQSNPTIATYVDSDGVYLRLTASAGSVEQVDELLASTEKQVIEIIGANVYGYDRDTLASVAARELISRGLRLGIAESCTGGQICSRLVSIPGVSDVFMAGIIAYSNEAKIRHLNVSAHTLREFGAVSRQTAEEMAKSMLRGCDIAVSSTGIAGPTGGSAIKPVGLVYICVTDREHTETAELRLSGQRTQIINNASSNALYMLIRFVQKYYD
ncbi:MAG TPA: competence/damage-inducible protein A [Clostridia bacterium]|nr:competence/damage-inducible protein A [Clostridia bacterium]